MLPSSARRGESHPDFVDAGGARPANPRHRDRGRGGSGQKLPSIQIRKDPVLSCHGRIPLPLVGNIFTEGAALVSRSHFATRGQSPRLMCRHEKNVCSMSSMIL
jgi:hypothetical protein